MEKKCSILIVDDDPGMTETLADVLGEMGYTVEVAEDGFAAIDKMKGGSYDATLMDIKMPGMNGVETFKELKRINPSTKVIMMTAYAMEELKKEALREGAIDVIHKPLDIDKVVSLIKKAVKSIMILVVDDDMNICETLKDVLEEKKYGVVVAQRGEEAIERVREGGIDIVLIDVKMPVLNGLETYLAIKEIDPEITAVMITGYRKEATALVDKAIINDAYMCLYKPLDMDEIIAVIDKICRHRRNGT